MRTTTEWIRSHALMEVCGYRDAVESTDLKLLAFANFLSKARVPPYVVKLMRPRLVVGALRSESKTGLGTCQRYAYLLVKCALEYEDTGNQEFLIDALNYTLLMWLTPRSEGSCAYMLYSGAVSRLARSYILDYLEGDRKDSSRVVDILLVLCYALSHPRTNDYFLSIDRTD